VSRRRRANKLGVSLKLFFPKFLFVLLILVVHGSTGGLVAGQCHSQWLAEGGRPALAKCAELRDETGSIMAVDEAGSSRYRSCAVERPESGSGRTGAQHFEVENMRYGLQRYSKGQLTTLERDSGREEWRGSTSTS